MRPAALALAIAALAAFPASALDDAQWPPPPETAQRMRELQHVIADPASTLPQRDAAREELSGLLKSPAGKSRGRTPDEKPQRPARAAIDPFPSVVKPFERVPAPPPREGVARIEVIEPPRPVIVPRTGKPAFPAGDFAITPDGRVLHPTPGGYVDPLTGQLIPR
jgi:hypothetical protein